MRPTYRAARRCSGPRGPRSAAAQQAAEESASARLVGVPGAALRGWNASHDLVDMLAAARPGRLSAGPAGHRTTHLAVLLLAASVRGAAYAPLATIPMGVSATGDAPTIPK